MTDASPDPFAQKRDHYIECLKPVFQPADPISSNIIRYFASLLRVLGMEDWGWDPYAESRAVLNDCAFSSARATAPPLL
jgi:hypothetical protein